MEWAELQYVCIGLFGVLLLVSSPRLYRYSIVNLGAAIGAYVGVTLTLGQSESIQLFGIGICAAVGAVTMLLVEKLAIALLCALIGGAVTQYAMLYYLGVPIEWYWVIVGSVLVAYSLLQSFPDCYRYGCPWQVQDASLGLCISRKM